MGLLLTTTAGLVLWIVLWAIGVNAVDGIMLTIVMIVLAATARMFLPFLSRRRGEEHPGSGWNPR